MLAYWEPYYIQNFVTFRVLAYLGPKAYQKPCDTSKMEGLAKLFKG